MKWPIQVAAVKLEELRAAEAAADDDISAFESDVMSESFLMKRLMESSSPALPDDAIIAECASNL